ncbi:MAG: hypothetical protein IJY88_03890 [Clostridia bacterium]|nr:hypothetical protein [Clostridia bacterium]
MKRKKTTYGIFKYFTAVILLLSLLLLATACDSETELSQPASSSLPESSLAAEGDESIESTQESTEESTQEIIWNPEELEYIDNLFAALQIEDDIEKYSGCYRFTDDDHSVAPILFVPKDVIYNVKIFSINDDWGDISEKRIENILYETEKVTDTKPLLADIKFIDIFAVRGISFTDKDGNEHFYEITDSPVDGSLIISEFVNPEAEESKEE